MHARGQDQAWNYTQVHLILNTFGICSGRQCNTYRVLHGTDFKDVPCKGQGEYVVVELGIKISSNGFNQSYF